MQNFMRLLALSILMSITFIACNKTTSTDSISTDSISSVKKEAIKELSYDSSVELNEVSYVEPIVEAIPAPAPVVAPAPVSASAPASSSRVVKKKFAKLPDSMPIPPQSGVLTAGDKS